MTNMPEGHDHNAHNGADPSEDNDRVPRTIRADQHFFWIESAFLDPGLKRRVSKPAWLTYLLFCRRASPAQSVNGSEISACFSGANDIVNVLGFPRGVATDAMGELTRNGFISPAPWIAPPPGQHLLKGRGHEIKLIPNYMESPAAFLPRPTPRTPLFVPTTAAFPRQHIFLPSKLFDDGYIRRCFPSWDRLRLLLHIYNLQDLVNAGGVPAHVLHVDPAAPRTRKVEAGEVDNPKLVGKNIHTFVDFNDSEYTDVGRYVVDPALYDPIGITRDDCLGHLVQLRKIDLVRWKLGIFEADHDDPKLSALAYEASPKSIPWHDGWPGERTFVEDIRGTGVPETATFILSTFWQAQTAPTIAYHARRNADIKALKKFGGAPPD